MQTILELFFCVLEGEEVRYHRFCQDISHQQQDPEELLPSILALLGISTDETQGCAHSTSWRYQEGQIMLTYLVWLSGELPSNLSTQLVDINTTAPTKASGPLQPRPKKIVEEQVLVHGFRHLCYLVQKRQEPYLTSAFQESDALEFLMQFQPVPAGRFATI